VTDAQILGKRRKPVDQAVNPRTTGRGLARLPARCR
jgi:hypothetical protein